MKYRIFLLAAVGTITGLVGGIYLSKYLNSLDDFPSVMTLRVAITEGLMAMPLKTAIQLLDVYEVQVMHQAKWPKSNGFDWDQEFINVALQRYAVYSKAGLSDLAEKALTRAASLRHHRPPTPEDLEFERQLSARLIERSQTINP